VAQLVEQWQRGKFSYQLACARCHGEDGNSEDYPYIKKLGGIGKRMSRDEIRDRLRAVTITREEISVRSHLFSRRDLDALLIYVAGL